uniref:Uncharacterized protein n=1 Tax=Marseillevirus LCMAC101 TaxID=2506602 RepID=A0A481YRU3_9VIRU|nr:MAG: hypothetical protein LCMAC101_05880 [Marseillevirus LCMAC101]
MASITRGSIVWIDDQNECYAQDCTGMVKLLNANFEPSVTVTSPLSGSGTAADPLSTSISVTSPLSGSGTVVDPLSLGSGTTNGDVMQWNGNSWIGTALPPIPGATILSNDVTDSSITFNQSQGATTPLTSASITLPADMTTSILLFYCYFQTVMSVIPDSGFILQATFTINGNDYPTLVYWIQRVGNPYTNSGACIGTVNMTVDSGTLSTGDVIGVSFRLNAQTTNQWSSTVDLPFNLSIPRGRLIVIGN